MKKRPLILAVGAVFFGVILGIIAMGMVKVGKAVEITAATSPVYRIVGRADITGTRPAAMAYVLERGGSLELLEARHLLEIQPLVGFTNTPFVVRHPDGKYWRLMEKQ
jgi:hypothetical protein